MQYPEFNCKDVNVTNIDGDFIFSVSHFNNTPVLVFEDVQRLIDWLCSQVDNWQPIETVPKDGTVIDLYGINHAGKEERWPGARWEPDYEEDDGPWKGPWSDGFDCTIPSRFVPTHWMPLPAPPKHHG